MRNSHVWRAAPAAAFALALAAPASADVTIKAKMTRQARGQTMASESTIMIKGASMRTDMTVDGVSQTWIIDVKDRRYISLDSRTRTATVTSVDVLKDQIEEMNVGPMTMEFAPTGEKKTVAGMVCDGYRIDATMPLNMRGGQSRAALGVGEPEPLDMTMTMTMTGLFWSAKDAPGQEEFSAFMKTASDAGIVLVNPSQRGLADTDELMRKIAEAGLPCASKLDVSMAGGIGEMARMLRRTGKSSMASDTVSGSTEALDGALFAVPDGYTVKSP